MCLGTGATHMIFVTITLMFVYTAYFWILTKQAMQNMDVFGHRRHSQDTGLSANIVMCFPTIFWLSACSFKWS